jgi:hypothetical protein
MTDEELKAAERRVKDAKADLNELMLNRKYEIEAAAAAIIDEYEVSGAMAKAELNAAERALNDLRRAALRQQEGT